MISIVPNDEKEMISIEMWKFENLLSAATKIEVIKSLIHNDSSSSAYDLGRKIMAVIKAGEVVINAVNSEENHD